MTADMRMPHDSGIVESLRRPTVEDPWRVLLSGCIAGRGCGVDGTDYGLAAALPAFIERSEVQAFPFCPEDFALGTPRTMPDIHGGDGDDVLDGRARIMDEHRVDLTDAMIRGAEAMLDFAREQSVEFAVLTDMSAACGSQVISLGCRLVEDRKYQLGRGVAAALLMRHGIPVVSQRDFRTLDLLHARLDDSVQLDPEARDHHDHPWVLENLRPPG